MSLPKPTIVLFDMDGTSVRHINPRLLHVLEFLDDLFFKCARISSWLFEKGAQGPLLLDDEDYANRKKPKLLVHRALHKFRRKPVEQIVEPCPGIYAVLSFLQSHDIPMGLASNGLGKGYGHDVLEKFGLDQYFRATIFREDIVKSKPHPDSILLVLQQMGVTLSKNDAVWYIGDRHKDILAAQAAAEHLPCQIVPIAYGLNAAVAVLEKNIGPDHILMSHHDIRKQLEKLLGKPADQSLRRSGS